MRVDQRACAEMRPIIITPNFLKTADGSAIFEFGDTKVLCTATIQNETPRHRKDTGQGWLTAEYAMLPRSSPVRVPRDGPRGHVASRSTEIQRMIGRSLRAVFDADKFGERTVIIDCDVLQADGGTRTAAISGGFVALALAMRRLVGASQASSLMLKDWLGAVSVGIVEGRAVLDLCYLEDCQADVDMNVVMTGAGNLVEVQGSAERKPFSRAQMDELIDLAALGVQRIIAAQKQALGIDKL